MYKGWKSIHSEYELISLQKKINVHINMNKLNYN